MNSEPANPLWLLFGDTGRELSCDISRMPSGHWAVTLSLGSEPMLSEEFRDLQTAMDGAARLKAGLIAKGWRPFGSAGTHTVSSAGHLPFSAAVRSITKNGA